MRCVSYCTAESYPIDDLAKHLRNIGLEPKFYDDVIHLEKPNVDEDASTDPHKHVFYFPYGCIVLWGYDPEEDEKVLSTLNGFQTFPLPKSTMDHCSYMIGDETTVQEEEDMIVLESQDPLIKLSISYGLSQSVKLEVFEKSVSVTIDQTRYIPTELSKHGKISMSRRDLSKMVGALFAQRNLVNFYSNTLDTPEFFWRRPKYEAYYHLASSYMDISTRLDILNARLNIIRELYEVLSGELNHSHSSRLEVVIIILIMIEVFLVLLKDVFKVLGA